MSDSDNSAPILRYNLITQTVEYFNGADYYPVAGSGGITTLTGDVTAGPGSGSQAATLSNTAAVKSIHADSSSNLTGAVQLVSGTNVTLSQVGQAITINASGGGGGSFTPQLYQFTAIEGTVVSATYVESGNMNANFTMADASHRVKVTFCGDIRFTGVPGEAAYLTLFVDHSDVCPDAAGFSGLLSMGTGPIVVPYSFSVVHTPGDTSAHTYGLAMKSDTASDTINCPYNAGTLIIEEII